MPMYFPDLESVTRLAESMTKHQEPGKRYKGIIPKTEEELPKARKQIAKYLREIWKDEIFALEVELGVSKENYHEKLGKAIQANFMKNMFKENK